MCAHQVDAGVVFDDGFLKVTAFNNSHMSPWEDDRCLSYSYRIECEGRVLVFSGDVGSYQELNPVIGEGCDGLVIETGHFGIDDVYQYATEKLIGHIFFCHNGREILNHPEESKEKVHRYFGEKGTICEDGLTVIL
jgi:ribonuclease BN (tRNA processing enzyme)